MKQLIVLLGVLPLLLIFMMQFTLDQKNNAAIQVMQEQVYAAREQARQEGCFTPEICASLRRSLSEKLNISEEDVEIEATQTRTSRVNTFDGIQGRGMIHYAVSVPVSCLMAGVGFFGIGSDRNQGVYTITGTAASEYIP